MTPLSPATVQHDEEGYEVSHPGGIPFVTAPGVDGTPLTLPSYPEDNDPPAAAPAEDPDPAPTTPAPASQAVTA